MPRQEVMLKLGGALLSALAVLALVALFLVVAFPSTVAWVTNRNAVQTPQTTPVAAITPSPSPPPSPSPSPSPSPLDRAADFQRLAADLRHIAAAGGQRGSVSLIELGGQSPTPLWSLDGDVVWPASSTYKLPLLMAEAQGIASGRYHGSDRLCYIGADYEAGFFADYAPGKCYTRDVLALRAGIYSDNTAGHILVRYLGGTAVLNSFARSMGASSSKFYVVNTTSTADLARMWASEARGAGGGAAAQAWLYPKLTRTYWEAGIPAGTPARPVVHKIGNSVAALDDAGLVVNGPCGPYVLSVITTGPSNSAGWKIIATLAARVWQFEAARPA